MFVGDAGQLASVDAGSVLGDITNERSIHSCVAELTETHRFLPTASSVNFQCSVARRQWRGSTSLTRRWRLGIEHVGGDGIVLEMVEEPADVDQFVRDHAVSLSASL